MDKRLDVIATGSALSMTYNNPSSYPVGYIDYLDMYALNFQEFLWCNGIGDEIIAKVYECFMERKAVPLPVHQKLLEYLRFYMITGGMPEVVKAFLTQRNVYETDLVQRTIYRDYIADIAHMAPPQIKIKSEKCYRSIR